MQGKRRKAGVQASPAKVGEACTRVTDCLVFYVACSSLCASVCETSSFPCAAWERSAGRAASRITEDAIIVTRGVARLERIPT